ncbi:MAG: hypothetical protein DRN14_06255, partial [Thermoplasmata archaeon]
MIYDGGTYKMWYHGYDGHNTRIGYATSADGITWTKQGSAVLDIGGPNDFDSFGVSQPWVIKDGSTYKMWYTASDGLHLRIAYATSNDGITWTKQGSAVLDLGPYGAFDDSGVGAPTVVKDSVYRMWYIGNDGTHNRIGYATSTDGITWSRANNGEAVMKLGSTFDAQGLGSPSVLVFNGVYEMYYHGSNGVSQQIGYATSRDGIQWERSSSPVLRPSQSGFDWKGTRSPSYIREGTTLKMWYEGFNGSASQIGYATATITSLQGTYLSPPFDFGGRVQLGTLNWTTETPQGTSISLEVRTAVVGGVWGDWFTPTNGGDMSIEARYFQYRVSMQSDNITKTPAFKDITLNYYKPVDRVEASVDGGKWYVAEGTETWTIGIGMEDGKHTVRFRAVDVTGDYSDYWYRNVTVNANPPTGSIVINDDAMYTSSRTVQLKLSAEDTFGVKDMMLSESPDFSGATWQPYKNITAFQVSEGDGTKVVYVKFRDTMGQESEACNDSIILDATAPEGEIVINNGTEYTTSREVLLKFRASDNYELVDMAVSTDPGLK